jgi:hypothetical protein
MPARLRGLRIAPEAPTAGTCHGTRAEGHSAPACVAVPLPLPQVKFCICGGRHTHMSILNDRLLINMTASMNRVTVDAAAKTATFGGGATLGEPCRKQLRVYITANSLQALQVCQCRHLSLQLRH